MADLLSWGNLLQKKKNELGEQSLISKIRQSVQSAKVTNPNPQTSISYATSMNNANKPTQTFKAGSFNAGTKNYNQNAVQQSTFKPKTFSLGNNFDQFNAKSQNQTEQEQKQNNLLSSSMNGKSLLSNLGSNISNIKQNFQSASQQDNGSKIQQMIAEVKQKAQNNEQPSGGNSRIQQMITEVKQKANAANTEGWGKYLEEERQKVRTQTDRANKNTGFLEANATWLQDTFNPGWDTRLAETAARNRYTAEQMNKAYDDNGNVKDQNSANLLKQLTSETMDVAKSNQAIEQVQSRKIGASGDSDYKDNPFYATLNAIRGMDIGNAVFEGDQSGATEAGRFLLNLLPGMATAPIQGGGNIAEALSGKGTDSETGKHRELTGLERMGRGVSGAIDAAGVFFGGSGDLLNAVGKKIFQKGATEATKQAVKQTSKGVIKGLSSSAFTQQLVHSNFLISVSWLG